MRRLVLAGLLLATACAPQTGQVPTPAPGSSSPSPSAASPLAPDPDAAQPADLLVAGPDGVVLLTTDGQTRSILTDAAAIAVDDTLGGVLFQAWSGRAFGDPAAGDTTIRWLKAGTGETAEVVSPEEGQTLELHDAVGTGRGTEVFYSRNQGSMPEDQVDTLVRRELMSGVSRDVAEIGGWESGARVSVSPSLIALAWVAEGSSWFDFVDHEGNEVEVPGNPLPEPTTDHPSPYVAELSGDGVTFAYVELGEDEEGFLIIPELVLVDVESGEETLRLRLERDDGGPLVESLDLGEGVIVINRVQPDQVGERHVDRPWIVDLRGDAPVVWEAPVAGTARLPRSHLAVG